MEGENATLRDGLVGDPTAGNEPGNVDPKPRPAPPPVIAPEDQDAIELGRILIENGIDRSKINDYLVAPTQLGALQHMIRNDPEQFLRELEKFDPQSAEKFHNTMTDIFVKRYAPPEGKKAEDKNASEGQTELLTELKALRERTQQLETAEQIRQNNSRIAQVRERYEARVDDVLNQESIKNLGLNKTQLKAMKAQISHELGVDPAIVQRINAGNLSDVPRVAKTIIEEWGKEQKSAADAEIAKREAAKKRSQSDFSSGPNPFMVEVANETFDSWDKTEEAFGKALERL